MDSLIIEGMNEDDFRCSIEAMLREGLADDAAAKLRALLEPYAGEGNILPPRFLTVSAGEVGIAGWDELAQRIGQYDRPNHRISALGIALTHPEDAGIRPDAAGLLAPCIETNYLSDEAYPFSEADRNDLLDGYSVYGCAWDGDSAETDSTLSVEGLDDLYGAIVQLETRLLACDEPGDDEVCAGSLGACYLAVLIYQAVNANIRKHGLPRPMCVMAGCNGVYPFFDAPVISSEECVDHGLVVAAAASAAAAELDGELDDELDDGDEPAEVAAAAHDYGSLLGSAMPRAKKRPVILLDEVEAAVAIRQIAATALATPGAVEAPVEQEEYASAEAWREAEVLQDCVVWGEPVGSEDVYAEVAAPIADEPDPAEPVEAAHTVEATADWSDWPAAEEAIAAALPESAYEPSAPEPADSAFAQAGDHAEFTVPEAEPELADAPAIAELSEPEPAPAIIHRGHGLREKLVQPRKPRATFTARLMELIGWLRAALARG